MNYWLVKSEPAKYSWDTFLKDKQTFWDGVRNYQARNNLMAMKKGDLVLFYHSVEEKEVIGMAEVIKEHYQDPTTKDTRWVAVDLKPVETLKSPVTLEMIKKDKRLQNIALIRQQRLSVMPLAAAEFNRILELRETE
ncbi:MAG: EVE domain-containing protein [Prevotellaceae bacterium]|jgi:predicted RNA-binding protein with PUA-like domain|nr:EVE domain-containing protein [Prevotellaceae bacterium]